MPDKQWPQGTPGASVPLTDAVEFGSYNSADPGATKNVKYTALEIKTYAEGTLSTDIAQNASDISDNTAAIGVNTGLINGNTIDISGNESRISANESRISANESNISTLDSTKATENTPVEFEGVSSGSGSVSLKWKRFTGTLDEFGVTEIAHGITGTIFNVFGSGLGTTQNFQFGGNDGINAVWSSVNWDSTDIQIRTSSIMYSDPYDILVAYID